MVDTFCGEHAFELLEHGKNICSSTCRCILKIYSENTERYRGTQYSAEEPDVGYLGAKVIVVFVSAHRGFQ